MSGTIEPTQLDQEQQVQLLEQLQQGLADLRQEIHKLIVGQDDVIDAVLSCILAGGHCLVQGVPGLAKTLLVQALSDAMDLQFNRIQFTPDLMPSDITGTEIIAEDPRTGHKGFTFVKGPLFAHIILADEINRTPPKTQSALLQAMQEKQITISRTTYPLEHPFFVMATQNPIEQEGTYPLPEAALDRFMYMVHIDYPTEQQERTIVNRTTGDHQVLLRPVVDTQQIIQFQQILRAAPVSEAVVNYGVRLVRASRPQDDQATDLAREYIKWGAGPRAAQFVVLGAKAHALIQDRVTPSFQDVQAAAKMVLRHRIITNFNAEADGVNTEDILNDLVGRIPPKTK